MQKILVIAGTRPEAIKLLPVYLEFKKNNHWETQLISTGQHKEMLWSIFDFFGVRPDHDMEIMTENQTLETLSSQILQKCADLFRQQKPNLVVVQGDTTTAMMAALSAFYQRIPVAHVEAGLRSHDMYAPFPEEINRRTISLITTLHFAPTRTAEIAIKSESVSGKIYNVGNTVIDSLLFARKKVRKTLKNFEQNYSIMLGAHRKMILITGHRRENFGTGFVNICDAIQALAKSHPAIAWIYPVHLNPNVREVVFQRLKNLSNVFLIDPVPYDHMVFLMMKSYFILTDSGGIQEEAPALGKPVIVMRNTTERPEGIKAGCSVLAGNSKTKIIKITNELLKDNQRYRAMAMAKSPYGDGKSAKKIVAAVKKFLM